MPDLVIRETLQGTVSPQIEGARSSSLIQKRINLPEGKKFRVKSIEIFDDNMYLEGTGALEFPLYVTRQTYVTPYPIVMNNSAWGFTTGMQDASFEGSGPAAGDNSVLCKRLDFAPTNKNSDADPTNFKSLVPTRVFPSHPTAFNTGFEWYTNHCYLSAIYNWEANSQDQPVCISFHIHLEVLKTSGLENAIGCYKEKLEAQCRVLTSTLNFIDPAASAAGRSFPMWKYGGIRPEIMITSANVLRYYNKLASADYQEMDNIDAFRTRFKEATTMVGYDDAFGDTTTGIPDWIVLMDVAGVTSGTIRPYPPPVKFSGNGNTVMYDADGVPASIVT
jgi:hypothetical protein